MANGSPVLLLLGAGSGVGASVSRVFTTKGYRIALVSRSSSSATNTSPEQIHIQADLSKPESIPSIFAKVEQHFGTVPSVVIYNSSKATRNPPENPFSLEVDELRQAIELMTLGGYQAAKEAVKGFETLPSSASRTFLYTGNILNSTTLPGFLDLGVGKSAAAHVVESAAKAFAGKGYKFYWVDERKEDGTPMYTGVSADAHADYFAELVDHKAQEEWSQTFVKGIGYKKF